MGGKRAGVDRLEEVVAAPVHAGGLLVRVGAPQQEHHAGAVHRDPPDDGVCQLLPAVVLKIEWGFFLLATIRCTNFQESKSDKRQLRITLSRMETSMVN